MESHELEDICNRIIVNEVLGLRTLGGAVKRGMNTLGGASSVNDAQKAREQYWNDFISALKQTRGKAFVGKNNYTKAQLYDWSIRYYNRNGNKLLAQAFLTSAQAEQNNKTINDNINVNSSKSPSLLNDPWGKIAGTIIDSVIGSGNFSQAPADFSGKGLADFT